LKGKEIVLYCLFPIRQPRNTRNFTQVGAFFPQADFLQGKVTQLVLHIIFGYAPLTRPSDNLLALHRQAVKLNLQAVNFGLAFSR